MKRITLPAALALTMALFVGCEQPPKKPPQKPASHSPTDTVPPPNGGPEDGPKPPANPPPDATKPPPAVPEQPVKVGEIPYAKPVPGKPGFVFSPYAEYKGYIDVRGFPPGTEVKDPYSGKSFLVP